MDGIIVVNKPKNMTSHDVVSFIRKHLKIQKVGHTGTLDPQAEGVLVVCVGSATKLSNYLMTNDKTYRATILFGISTTTDDLEGEVTDRQKIISLEENVFDQVMNGLIGKSQQIPPMYSAIKKNGKKLYQYALNNESVEIAPREIEIYSIKRVTPIIFHDDLASVSIELKVSKGTYIRSIARLLGESLNLPSTLSGLIRLDNAGFTLSDSCNLDDIENNKVKVIPIDKVLEYIKIAKLFDEKLVYQAQHGMKISYNYIWNKFNLNDERIAIVNCDSLNNETKKLVAIYRLRTTEENKKYYKAERVWN